MYQYYPYVIRLAESILGDPDDAEDVAQETFIRVATHLENYRGEAGIKTWLYVIALNVCRGKLRVRKAQRILLSVLSAWQALSERPLSPEKMTEQSELYKKLEVAVDGLDEKHRLPLILRYVHQLTIPEIAKILELNEGTVHSRLHHTREKLGRHLGRYQWNIS